MKIYEQLEQARRDIGAAQGTQAPATLLHEIAASVQRLEEAIGWLVAQEKARSGKNHSQVFSRPPENL